MIRVMQHNQEIMLGQDRTLRHRLASVLLASLIVTYVAPLKARDKTDDADKDAREPLSKRIITTGTVDDELYGKVRNVAATLQSQAISENRKAVLVLQITQGTSHFHQVQGLAKFLTSAELSRIKTVAWVPETLVGNNVVLALACKEIVMHPDAELGDISQGQPLDNDERQFVLNMVGKRYNVKLSRALALGMMVPGSKVLKVQLRSGRAGNLTVETLILTEDELKKKRDEGADLPDVKTIKDVADPMTFSGRRARDLDILVVRTAETLRDVADSYNLPPESLRTEASTGEKIRPRLIKIEGEIEPVMASFIKRQIRRSIDAGANLLIFEIDSGGGHFLTSQDLAETLADIDAKNVRTVAYIPKQALSGAAMIALGCSEIYLHPEAKFGDAGPIIMGPDGRWAEVSAKRVSLVRQVLASLARKRNRPEALAMAMADKNLKVYQVNHRESGRIWYMSEDEIDQSDGEWIKGRIVSETGEDLLLTVPGARAQELELAESNVRDFDDLKKILGIPGVSLEAVGPSWVDRLIFWLNTNEALGVLVALGVICIFIELHLMTGLLGIISVVCFGLVFWSRAMGGTAGWLEIMLFLMGLACIVMEIFVIPGFGVFGISGGLLVVSSLILASQTFGDMGGSASDFAVMSDTVKTLGVSIVSVLLVALVLNRFLPHVPIFNRVILTPPGHNEALSADAPRLRPEFAATLASGDAAACVGLQGVSLTVLRPAGKAQFDGRPVDVVSEGPFIAQGRNIEVVEIAGNRTVVRELS